MRKGVKGAIVGGVFAAMVGTAGYGAYNLVGGITGGGGDEPAPVKTGPPSAAEVRWASGKFFAAWEKGNAEGAAGFTDNAVAAGPMLAEYRDDARITEVRITPGTPTGQRVPFKVSATVSYEDWAKPLSYASELTVVRGRSTGVARAAWKPSVLHPDLKEGDTLVTGQAAAPPIEAVGRDNTVLTKEKYPSLGPVLDVLRERYGDRAGGTPGVELAIRHAAEEAGDETLLTLAKGTPGKVRTTLSATAQAAAEKAVRKFAESSVVALEPSTGQVLAVANHRDDGFNAAFQGELAPGSTMKIITAAMLIDNGLTTMNGPAPCPDTAVWKSQTFHNLKNMTPDEGATLADSFTRSCNTAFVKLIDGTKAHPLTDESLTREAQEKFGLGTDNWKTGIPSFDGRIPASAGPDRAANAIGQGKVQMSPLNMASATATAITGTFRQPVIVSSGLDDRELATAEGLSASTVAQLKQMMRLTATGGTAAQAMAAAGGGDIGAKTGSAETDGNTTSDSWFTGFRNDVAAAAVVESGGHGGDAAGPIVAAVLRASG